MKYLMIALSIPVVVFVGLIVILMACTLYGWLKYGWTPNRGR